MTKLQSLKSRLEQLPATRKLKGLLGNMGQFQKKLGEAATALEAAARNEEQANAVFGAGQVAVVPPERRKAARVAKKLAAKLREDIEAVSTPRAKVNEAVTTVSEIAAGAGKDVKAAWQRLIDQKVKPYDKLVEVARKLGLSGADELAAVMEQLKAAREAVPATPERASAVAKRVQDLPAAVQRLGLDDPAVRQFVVEAAAGSAKLKAFADNPSVGEFIQRHKLWDLFRVGIP